MGKLPTINNPATVELSSGASVQVRGVPRGVRDKCMSLSEWSGQEGDPQGLVFQQLVARWAIVGCTGLIDEHEREVKFDPKVDRDWVSLGRIATMPVYDAIPEDDDLANILVVAFGGELTEDDEGK